jgi:hypothetical protein
MKLVAFLALSLLVGTTGSAQANVESQKEEVRSI